MQLLNVKEAAAILKISVWTLRRYLREGKVHGYKHAFGWRIDQDALEDFIQNQKNVG